MREAKVRWGVGFRNNKTLIRCRDANGKLFAVDDRALALDHLVRWYRNDKTIRLVKLTRRAKVWRPVIEKPPINKPVLAQSRDGKMHVASFDGDWWTGFAEKVVVTHWRHLPKGPA